MVARFLRSTLLLAVRNGSQERPRLLDWLGQGSFVKVEAGIQKEMPRHGGAVVKGQQRFPKRLVVVVVVDDDSPNPRCWLDDRTVVVGRFRSPPLPRARRTGPLVVDRASACRPRTRPRPWPAPRRRCGCDASCCTDSRACGRAACTPKMPSRSSLPKTRRESSSCSHYYLHFLVLLARVDCCGNGVRVRWLCDTPCQV